jgi:hypothetical protein
MICLIFLENAIGDFGGKTFAKNNPYTEMSYESYGQCLNFKRIAQKSKHCGVRERKPAVVSLRFSLL